MKWLRALTRVVAAALIVLLLGEIFVRLFVGGPSPQVFDAEIGYRYLPGATLFQAKEGRTRLRFNSLGLNDVEPDAAGGRCRIVVVGDSYTAALQVPRESNFTSVAERLDGRLDVVNAGRDGLFLGDLHKVAARLAPALMADLVVYVVSERAIDTDIRLPGLDVTTDPVTGAISDMQMRVEQQEGLKRLFGPVLNRSALATRLSAQFKPMAVGFLEQVQSWKGSAGTGSSGSAPREEGGDRQLTDEQLLLYMFDRFRRNGPSALLYINGINYGPGRAAMVATSSSQAEGLAARVAGRLDLPFRDTGSTLIEAFGRTGKPPFGFDNALLPGGHLNEVGHEAVGRSLVDLVHSMAPRLPNRCTIP